MRAPATSERSVEGSFDAFRAHIDRWLARRRLPPEDRKDLIQDVWEEVLAQPEVVKGARIPRAVIHTIAKRRWIDYVRRRKRDPHVLLPTLPSIAPILSRTASSKISRKLLVARCRDALGDPASRRILALLVGDGMFPAEIAAVLEAEGFRNRRGGVLSANSVSQKIRREILPVLAQLSGHMAR